MITIQESQESNRIENEIVNTINVSIITIPITATEIDLTRIGGTTCGIHDNDIEGFPEGGTSFIIDNNIEYIFLRSILTSLGFSLSEGEDFCWENGRCDIIVHTTYPWNRYMSLHR